MVTDHSVDLEVFLITSLKHLRPTQAPNFFKKRVKTETWDEFGLHLLHSMPSVSLGTVSRFDLTNRVSVEECDRVSIRC